MLARRGVEDERGGRPPFRARRGRTIRMCSLDARSRREARPPLDRKGRVPTNKKTERRQAASKPVAFNASPRSVGYCGSDRPRNIVYPELVEGPPLRPSAGMLQGPSVSLDNGEYPCFSPHAHDQQHRDISEQLRHCQSLHLNKDSRPLFISLTQRQHSPAALAGQVQQLHS